VFVLVSITETLLEKKLGIKASTWIWPLQGRAAQMQATANAAHTHANLLDP
jgi:hypothetical protein